ncbi:type II toxin-antitoxin system PemK/MazF family toxin [Clostridium kluyveri]|uniref:Growth inhibitor PemK n=1 Tax=Clostridium kluyveri TaxID=1534 RepID=A0A1L5FDN6_CLOKL|nr:type II toxin-antitoxin system PemK/MazF family toxin [Clostridium kluyveri]APM41121.1 growth inhibitor PemK [Clostridium kluyveri]UZQ48602.1 type II toxin-antitoxin system PemK/MazF family toxin [Clostridium kluyveri]
MGEFIKGDVVVVPFPFSDLSNSKRRPALVLADPEGHDLILSQITSQNICDIYSIKLRNDDFTKEALMKDSNIRPNKIFTADENIIIYRIGHLANEKMKKVTETVIEILTEE